MNYREMVGDLFVEGKGAYLAHCISSDFALGAGIATVFRDMGVAFLLGENHYTVRSNYTTPCCLETSAGRSREDYKGVFNLVTKEKCWHKPTNDSLRTALLDMRKQVLAKMEKGEKVSIYMPLIGCGLDKLKWEDVSAMIQEIFQYIDVDITVCKLGWGNVLNSNAKAVK